MTDMPFRPLGAEDDSTYQALHAGVTNWMSMSFWRWVRDGITVVERSAYGNTPRLNVELLRKAERVLRFSTGYQGPHLSEAVSRLQQSLGSGLAAIALADFLLAGNAASPHQLDAILSESGSEWKVGVRDGRPGLIRRVPEGVQANFDDVAATSGQAGARLAQAWERAFGISPDPSAAYALAVRAVEDAAIPVVVPSQKEASLGHVIGQLRNDNDWCLPLTREDPNAPTSETVVRMLVGLWKGHHDRHGASGHEIPEVGQEEAETAVTLAVPLVQWFSTGMIARR